MTREKLERAKVLISCIESAEHNIRSLERICDAGKGEIVICTKERLNGGHGNVNPIYITGEKLEIIKNAYINYWKQWEEEQQKEFDSL